jgi:hypothetical protein
VAFDAGTGGGAFVVGFVVGAAGFSLAFYLYAAVLVAALGLIPRAAEKRNPEMPSSRWGRASAPLQTTLRRYHLVQVIYELGQVGHTPVFPGASNPP